MAIDTFGSARLLFASMMLLALFSASAHAAKPVCVEGSSLPSDPRLGVRPTRSALCPYDFDELVERITELSTDKRAIDSVETVQRAFGIPEMTTTSDDTRISNYLMSLSGTDGWKLLVWVREAFYPTNKGPDRFVPGLRPKRLFSVRKATLTIDLDFTGRLQAQVSPQCMAVTDLIKSLKGKGWKDVTLLGYATDGALLTPAFEFGDKSVDLSQQPGECAENITLRETPSRH
ncbi:hypothetical protein ACFFJT_20490 [Dyella flava]|uniref:Secreted protein n=1 Tax=Dyella flava TaxID=1920170 RepID=A0ABS2K0Q6_9GAMM|nr:hypothetical protein [Dyella flava]MBM7124689.1 hypothetical protein [Dyella flava]GLQ49342.1 hypothetical protein GCM10010872_07910 [Dyella flava]